MQKKERIAGCIFLTVGIAVAAHSYAVLETGDMTSPDAGFMPFLLGIALCILSLSWLFQKVPVEVKGQAEIGLGKKRKLRLLFALALIFVYAWLFERIGYLTSTLVFMGLWQIMVEHEKPGKTLVIAGCSTFCLFLLFSQLLNVPLPKELFLR